MRRKIEVNDRHVREAFATNLRKIATEKNLTQSKLGEMIGISNDIVSKWMLAKAAPSWQMLVVISDIFEIKVADLLKDDEEEQKKEFEQFKNFRRFYKVTGGLKSFKTVANIS